MVGKNVADLQRVLLAAADLSENDLIEERALMAYEDPAKLERDVATLGHEFREFDRDLAVYLLERFGGNVRQAIHFVNWASESSLDYEIMERAGLSTDDLISAYDSAVTQEIRDCPEPSRWQTGYRDSPRDSGHYLEHMMSKERDF